VAVAIPGYAHAVRMELPLWPQAPLDWEALASVEEEVEEQKTAPEGLPLDLVAGQARLQTLMQIGRASCRERV
jgi:hypothetical protein